MSSDNKLIVVSKGELTYFWKFVFNLFVINVSAPTILFHIFTYRRTVKLKLQHFTLKKRNYSINLFNN